MTKEEVEVRILKLKNELYDGSWHDKNGEWHDGGIQCSIECWILYKSIVYE